jgi:hypothetical protein
MRPLNTTILVAIDDMRDRMVSRLPHWAILALEVVGLVASVVIGVREVNNFYLWWTGYAPI